ncbi:MAG TPA: BatA and WFA domain-containing protein, partial [Pirellulales bacterium]
MWNVLHSWAIPLGAAALCLPLVIHLLTRPKPVRLPLSTLRFVRQAVEQKRARSRLRDWLVLALRTLAVALLAAALARPLIGTHDTADDAPAQATRVVLVDVSQSMAAGDHGISAWQRARAVAARHLQFRPGLRTNLILAGASPRTALDAPSSNFTALAEELTSAAVRSERIDVKAALEASARMLAAGLPAQPELIVISDFQRTNWASADFAGLPQQTRIVLESVAPPQPPPNLAIVRVGSTGGDSAGQEALVEVEVANFSTTPQTVNVEIELGSQLHRLTGVCGARARLTLTRPLGPSSTGWHSGIARLAGVGDSLNADNSRPFVVDVRRPPTYLLVTRQSASQRPSSSYYLERALVPLERQGNHGPKLVRLDPVRLDLETLAPADLLILDHPGKLPASTTNLLASLVRRGRALLYVTAERVDATNLKLLLDAAGAAVHLPVEFFPAPSNQARR